MKKKKILVVSPHLSTGGAPQVTLNKIQLINNQIETNESTDIDWF